MGHQKLSNKRDNSSQYKCTGISGIGRHEEEKKIARESSVIWQEARTQIADMTEGFSGIGMAKH